MLEDLYFYTYRKCFFPLDHSPIDETDYVLLGIPFDSTQTGKTGSRYGPCSIRLASFELESYDMETGMDLSKISLHDIGDIDCVPGSPSETCQRISHTYSNIPKDVKVITLGGEHSITFPISREMAIDSVISFDAHPDLRKDYMGLDLSHSSVMRRIKETGTDVEVLGVREGSLEEANYASDNEITLFSPDALKEYEVPSGKEVYMSLDLDVFDNIDVGNPVPGGISINEFLDIAEMIIANNNVMGLDIVELCSQPNELSSYYAAKLLFKLLSYLEMYR